ncbi:SCO family protein [Gracilimonas tropica]|uniref:SCO family protein n=1 Tax=Gracilimonas tropica TaxID=454600 RepID=UPI00037586A9|nr:SCO family protein [Gracilimonas tropica]
MKTLIILSGLLMAMFSQNAMAQHGGHMGHQQEALKAGDIHPDHSLYHLDAEFVDHRKAALSLDDFKGEPVIIVMFYGNCTQVCPILIQDAWRLYSSLDNSAQAKTNVLAVSFDTENDTPEVLKNYAEYEQLDLPKWHFVTGKHTDIRMLATLLGVKYQKTGDGNFAHSNLITVLDIEGKIAKRVEGLNQPVSEAAELITNMLTELN